MPSSPKLATDPAGQLHILGHDCDPLGMDGTQVGVLKQSNKVGLAGLLQSLYRRGLETNRGEEGLCNLPHQPLEWQLPDQKLSGFLVTFNLSQSHRPRSVSIKSKISVSFQWQYPILPVWFSNSSTGRSTHATRRSLSKYSRNLHRPSWCLPSCRLSCDLFFRWRAS